MPLEVDVAVDAAESSRVVTELGPDAVVETCRRRLVVVRLVVTDVEAFVSWVLDLLDHAEVLRPPRVRNAVIGRLDAFVAAGCDPMSAAPDTAGRLRRLLAMLAWLAQEGEAPIDEVAKRFDLSPDGPGGRARDGCLLWCPALLARPAARDHRHRRHRLHPGGHGIGPAAPAQPT